MKKIFIFQIMLSLSLSQPDPYQQFLEFMNTKGGRILEIEFYQEQYGERYNSTGTFFYLGEMDYTFDANDQRISFNKGEIITINKIDKQVIYDKSIPGEVTIFDILIGEKNAIQTGEPLLEKNGLRIPFTLKEWDMRGAIRTNPSNGKPREIILNTDEDSEIRIKIISSKLANEQGARAINLTEYEIIDLRE
ncbi:MAG: hypothetical protein HN674_03715 [Candidatus Marinimicrobia bacterium]|nr:hypothetical protein [Candidatus Neomarinimicrobiota bacterium]MBT3502774.1 hypothetical protein [Candidatus Neomarinimicrobiota bacterium]MBT3839312.1 hypothetical protein [Candidatus Neomarinimicrobiota bacterium]MBT3999067.1 hypothetical protein [Candidatus Neomarinimicrobiota bacterium]MBT4579826.1 hypothetical protein [Candidatus Neomarinimicrobiota bacterium]